MKKTILITVFALTSFVAAAQSTSKKVNPVNAGQNGKIPDTVKRIVQLKDTVKVDPVLHIALDRAQAEVVLKGLQASYAAVLGSESITAASGTKAQQITGFFINQIYKKWPDLIPQQPVQ